MSTAQTIAPTPMATSVANTRTGLASFRTIFSSNTLKRHTISGVPSSDSTRSSGSSTVSTPNPAIPSFFPTGSRKRSMEKAAERDRLEQAKQIFQLSTVNDRGAFLPPAPLDKDFGDDLKEHDEDFFATIVSTPPERVKTFLSTESRISPGMFSPPQSQGKRHSIPSFSSSSTLLPYSPILIQSNRYTPTSVVIAAPSSQRHTKSLSVPVPGPPAVPVKNIDFMPSPPNTPPHQIQHQPYSQDQMQQPQRPLSTEQQQEPKLDRVTNDAWGRSRAQISFLTGASTTTRRAFEEDDLLDPFSSLLSSSPPELVSDEDHEQDDSCSSGSSSSMSSPAVSPRHSLTLRKEHIRKMNTMKFNAQNNFGGDLRIMQ